jgi:hypothetical protein
MGKQG